MIESSIFHLLSTIFHLFPLSIFQLLEFDVDIRTGNAGKFSGSAFKNVHQGVIQLPKKYVICRNKYPIGKMPRNNSCELF